MFTTPLRLEATTPGRWMLTSDLIWHSDTERYVVPRGFETDLASIPRIFRWLLNQNGGSRRPAVLHDYLYRMQPISRAEADAIFRRALEAEGVILPGRWLYWSGVRLGGWIAWRGHSGRGGRRERRIGADGVG